ncbi:MAG: hypothetical protein COU35_02790 [Candidatus Magasanikbacteria bacterium CG10_big_fil_rev_8_21_14_0_10_47_10]|uniref:Uncharacterized protein n=1 Tax=Candidatus Magasanikbacteria bacterium CG10_big_fil_rev_8_21_14_0_10_47_10 TaxID=1974652 RepID=A0A2H0TQA6_9BACT|nr:MAG: hypothetical protein COU35_02790 [Candidatus Magasanikbacteria bacterium CG10_big_fil_rev_8_21_14_0_10_47_10]
MDKHKGLRPSQIAAATVLYLVAFGLLGGAMYLAWYAYVTNIAVNWFFTAVVLLCVALGVACEHMARIALRRDEDPLDGFNDHT